MMPFDFSAFLVLSIPPASLFLLKKQTLSNKARYSEKSNSGTYIQVLAKIQTTEFRPIQ